MRDAALWEDCMKLMKELGITWEINISRAIILVDSKEKHFLVLSELYGWLCGYKYAQQK